MGALRLDEGARRLSRNRGRGGEGGRTSAVAKGSGVLGPRAALRDPRARGAMSDCKGGIVGAGQEVCERVVMISLPIAHVQDNNRSLEKGRRAQR